MTRNLSGPFTPRRVSIQPTTARILSSSRVFHDGFPKYGERFGEERQGGSNSAQFSSSYAFLYFAFAPGRL